MPVIRKSFLISQLSQPKYKRNKIARMTLKVISDRKFKIDPISKKHHHFTRKAYEYSAMAWQINQTSILINEKYTFTDNHEILETCVHEVNHCLNEDIFTNDSSCPMKLEVMAYIAEYCFKHSVNKINRSQFQDIKDRCFNDYRKFFKSTPKYVSKRVYRSIDYNILKTGILIKS
jgi:hypothetical protein